MLNITNSFVPHTDIKAEDVNQNFTDIQTWANNQGIFSTWSPTIGLDNAVWTTTSVILCKSSKVNKTVFFSLGIQGNISAGNNNFIYFSLPYTPASGWTDTNTPLCGGLIVTPGGTSVHTRAQGAGGAGNIYLFYFDGTKIPLGTGFIIYAWGIYESAT